MGIEGHGSVHASLLINAIGGQGMSLQDAVAAASGESQGTNFGGTSRRAKNANEVVDQRHNDRFAVGLLPGPKGGRGVRSISGSVHEAESIADVQRRLEGLEEGKFETRRLVKVGHIDVESVTCIGIRHEAGHA